MDAIPSARVQEFSVSVGKQAEDLSKRCDTWVADVHAAVYSLRDGFKGDTCQDVPHRDSVTLLGSILEKLRSLEVSGVLLEQVYSRVRNSYAQLGHVPRMSQSYDKAMMEIARRKRFKDKYLDRLQQMRSELSALRSDEDERRKRFNEKYGKHLPASLIPSLNDSVGQVTITLAQDFDFGLPDVSASGFSECMQESVMAESTFFGRNSGRM